MLEREDLAGLDAETLLQLGIDRFNAGRDPVQLTLIDPLVVEVSADVALSGRAFRHSVRYLRARSELDIAEVASPER